MFLIHANDKLAPSAHQQLLQHVLTREALRRISQKEHDKEATATIQKSTEAWDTTLKTLGQPEQTTLNNPLVTLAMYKWGACVCILFATPILSDLQQRKTDNPQSDNGQTSPQLHHRLLSTTGSTTSPTTFPVAEVSSQLPNTPPSRQPNPQSPKVSEPPASSEA